MFYSMFASLESSSNRLMQKLIGQNITFRQRLPAQFKIAEAKEDAQTAVICREHCTWLWLKAPKVQALKFHHGNADRGSLLNAGRLGTRDGFRALTAHPRALILKDTRRIVNC